MFKVADCFAILPCLVTDGAKSFTGLELEVVVLGLVGLGKGITEAFECFLQLVQLGLSKRKIAETL